MGEWETLRVIGETRTLRVVIRGNSYYLSLPREVVEIHGIMPGDAIMTSLDCILRPKTRKEEAERRD